MRIYKIICGFIAFLAFLSCRSAKMHSELHEFSSVQLHDSTALHLSQGAELKESTWTGIVLDEITDFDFTLYSPPDSAGRQYVAAKGTATSKRNVKETQQSQKSSNDSTVANYQKNEQSEKQTHRKSLKARNFKFLGTLIGLFLLYIIYRKWLHFQKR